MTNREHPEFKAMTLSMLWRDNPELYKRFERSDRFWRRCYYEASAELRRLRKERNAKPRFIDGPPAKPSGGITTTLSNVAQLAIAPLLLLLFHLATARNYLNAVVTTSANYCATILTKASNYPTAILTKTSNYPTAIPAAILTTASNQVSRWGRRFRLPRPIPHPSFTEMCPLFFQSGALSPKLKSILISARPAVFIVTPYHRNPAVHSAE